jgi:hypothetical protein
MKFERLNERCEAKVIGEMKYNEIRTDFDILKGSDYNIGDGWR